MNAATHDHLPQWQVALNSGLQAHFFQPDGTSKPGTDYAVRLQRGTEQYSTIVRCYLADDLTPAARADTHYQGQTVIGYVFDRLAAGWTPDQEALPDLTVLNPDPGYVHRRTPARRSLIDRLLGRR